MKKIYTDKAQLRNFLAQLINYCHVFVSQTNFENDCIPLLDSYIASTILPLG